MILDELKNQLTCEDFVTNGIVLTARSGSYSYGASTDDSDVDMFCITIPPPSYLFPSLYGEIEGFGTKLPRFEEHQQHHIHHNESVYDVNIHNITKFFTHCMTGNPNAIDKLFTPEHCILQSTKAGNLILENRNMFLSKMCIPRFIGFATSHIRTMIKLKEGRERYQKLGYDAKDAAHVVRQLLGLEEILKDGCYTLDKNAELIRAIRACEFSLESAQSLIHGIIENIKKLEITTKIQENTNELKIKQLLLDCLKAQYGY